jgi:DNA invertase Pin-like site-specific DNA recombinase
MDAMQNRVCPFSQGRGVKFGRKRKLTQAQIAHVREQIEKGKKGRQEIAALFNVDRSTLYRALAD